MVHSLHIWTSVKYINWFIPIHERSTLQCFYLMLCFININSALLYIIRRHMGCTKTFYRGKSLQICERNWNEISEENWHASWLHSFAHNINYAISQIVDHLPALSCKSIQNNYDHESRIWLPLFFANYELQRALDRNSCSVENWFPNQCE